LIKARPKSTSCKSEHFIAKQENFVRMYISRPFFVAGRPSR
jgi:hypothetical protein